MKGLSILSVLIVGILLTCGCSGGLDEVTVEDRIIRLRLTNDAGEEIGKIDAGSPGHLTATLKDASGKPLANEVMTFSTTLGYFQPATATGVTDANGEARVVLLAGPVSGAGEVTASFGQYSSVLSFASDGDQDVNMSLRLLNEITGESTHVISAGWPGRLEVVLSYGNGMPIPDQRVSFTTTLGNIQPAAATVTTDENGQASVLVFAGTVPGDAEAVATFDTYSTVLGFVTYAEQDIHLSIQLLNNETAQPTNLISAISPGKLEAALSFTNGTPIPNRIIRFDSTLGELQPGNGRAMTDGEGKAFVTLLAGSTPGNGQATVRFGDNDEYSSHLNFVTAGDQEIRISLRLTDHEGNEIRKISTDAPGYLEASLGHANGIPIASQEVRFDTTLGEIHPQTRTALTNSDGKASVLILAGLDEGVGDATATLGDYSASLSFMTSGDQDIVISLKLTDDQGNAITKVSTDMPGHLTATLAYTSGAPMVNRMVRFSTTQGELHPSDQTALTDESGHASILLLAGSTAGVGDATATFDDRSDTLSFVADADDPQDIILSLQLTDDKGSPMDTIREDMPGHLVATLTYSGGNPVSNQVVQFGTTLGMIRPSDGRALTDAEGKADILLLAGSAAGVGDAAVTFNAYSDTLSFVADVDDPKDVILSLRLTNDKGSPMDTIREDMPGHLTANLTYAGGTPAPNQVISFETTLGNIYPADHRDVIDSEGNASVLLLAGSAKGIGTATAAYDSRSDTLSFSVDVEPEDILLSLTLTNDSGETLSQIRSDAPGHLTAFLAYAGGEPVSGKTIYFNTTLGSIAPENRTAMTDSHGQAKVLLLPGSVSGVGDATATFDDRSATVSFMTDVDELGQVHLSLGLVDAEGNDITGISEDAPGYLEARLMYESGNPVISQIVYFSTTKGDIRPVSHKAATDIDGKARVLLVPGSVSGVGDATATFGNRSAIISFTVDVQAPEEMLLSLQLMDDAGNAMTRISSRGTGHLTATLTSLGGLPVPNEEIHFQSQAGTIYPDGGTATTDSEGKAAVLFVGGDADGPGEATATFGKYSASANFVIMVESPEPINISLDLLDDDGKAISSIRARGTARLVATLKYEGGQPVPNQTVRFQTTMGQVHPENGLAVTDTEGIAGVLLVAGSSGGMGEAAVHFEARSDALNFMVEGEILTLWLENSAGDLTDTVSAASPGRLVAILRDANGTWLPGQVVTFTSTLGHIIPPAGTALTDHHGQASVDLMPGSVPGAGEAVASAGEHSASVGFESLGDQPNLSIRLVKNDSGYETHAISAEYPGRIEALLTDDSGAPMSGEIVTFAVTSGILDPEDGNVLTDRDGRASAILSAGTEPGPGTITALSGAYSASLNFTSLGDELDVRILSLEMRNAQGEPITHVRADIPGRVLAVLTDADRTPLPHQVIAFATTPELGHFVPLAGTALTNDDGVAAIDLLAGSKPGAGVITAVFSDPDHGEFSASLSFTTAGDQSDEISLLIRLVNSETGETTDTIRADVTARLEALIIDRNGNPMPDQVVYFSTTAGIMEPSMGIALTNEMGKASVLLIAVPYPGPGVATARYDDDSASIGFEIE